MKINENYLFPHEDIQQCFHVHNLLGYSKYKASDNLI